MTVAPGYSVREAGQVRGRRTGEGVDGLPRVADHADVIPAAEPHVEHELLQRVHVLVLVHDEEGIPVPDRAGGLLVVGHDGRGQLQHRLEVHEVALGSQRLVSGVEPAERGAVERAGPARAAARRRVIVGPHLGDLGPLNFRGRVPQLGQAGPDPGPAGRLGQQADLGLQHPRRLAADRRRPEVGELTQRRGVERARLHLLQAGPGHERAQLPQPPPQLPRRPRGERDGEHPARTDLPGRREVGDPVRDRPGLAGPRPGQHADRPVASERNLPLLGIERGQDRRWPVRRPCRRYVELNLAVRGTHYCLAPFCRLPAHAMIPHGTDVRWIRGQHAREVRGVVLRWLNWDSRRQAE